jgi:hypothetical protein
MAAGRAVLRPGAVRVDPRGSARGVVTRRTFRGDHLALDVAVDGVPMVEVPVPADDPTPVGEPVPVALDPAGVLLYPSPGGAVGSRE